MSGSPINNWVTFRSLNIVFEELRVDLDVLFDEVPLGVASNHPLDKGAFTGKKSQNYVERSPLEGCQAGEVDRIELEECAHKIQQEYYRAEEH